MFVYLSILIDNPPRSLITNSTVTTGHYSGRRDKISDLAY